MRKRTEPRHLAPRDKRRPKPLDLTPEHPGKGWARALAGIFLTAVLPTVLLWWECGRK